MARTFTPDEANRALAEVRPLAESLVAHSRALVVAQTRRDEAAASIAGNGGGLMPDELAELAQAVDRETESVADSIRAIQRLGAQVKDLETGLIDFPARRGDEDVLLCWRVGEPKVAFWHGLANGAAGRRPLPFD